MNKGLLFAVAGTSNPEAAAAWCRHTEVPVILCTIMAPLDFPSAVEDCRRTGAGRLFLVPFSVAAGPSATEGIGGPSPSMWRSRLEKEGFDCTPVLRGLADYDGIVQRWVEQAETLLRSIS